MEVKKVISWKNWQYKIEPYIQKSKVDLFKYCSIELNRLRKLKSKHWILNIKLIL